MRRVGNADRPYISAIQPNIILQALLLQAAVMADASFQTNSLSWQVQQWNQQGREWVELQFSRLFSDLNTLPDWTAPQAISTILFWGLVGAIAFGVVLQLYRLVRPYLRRLKPPASANVRSPLPRTDWLAEAQTLQRQGEYALACRALYWAMLQRLDETKQLPRQDSRTDREYLNGVQTFANPSAYQTLLNAHEQFWFGQVPLSAADFQRCWQAYQEIAAE